MVSVICRIATNHQYFSSSWYSSSKSCACMRSGLPVMLAVTQVIFQRRRKAFFDADTRFPAGRGIELRRRAVDAADVDGFLFIGEGNDAIRAAAGRLQEYLDEFLERNRPNACEIEVVATELIVRSCDEKSVDHVVDVVEAPDLLPVAEYLNLLAVDGLFDKPSDETLARVLDELPRTICVDQPQRYSVHSMRAG